MVKRKRFSSYAEGRYRVTQTFEDVVQMHRLLGIQRRVMEPPDAMIANIQEGHRQEH
jgi:hypothetical protein